MFLLANTLLDYGGFFPFSILKMSSHCLLVNIVSHEKFPIILTFAFLYDVFPPSGHIQDFLFISDFQQFEYNVIRCVLFWHLSCLECSMILGSAVCGFLLFLEHSHLLSLPTFLLLVLSLFSF